MTKKWREKTRETIFPEIQEYASKNFFLEKNRRKKGLIVYKLSHEYRDQKIRGNKRAKQFFAGTHE